MNGRVLRRVLPRLSPSPSLSLSRSWRIFNSFACPFLNCHAKFPLEFFKYFKVFEFIFIILFFSFIFCICLYRARYRNLKTFADCHLQIWVRFEILIGFLFLLSTFSPTTVLETRVRVGVQQSDRRLWGIARSRSCEARALPGRRGIPDRLTKKKNN